jgi:acyl-coenzyme A synthetase/AMP-(fatty) acid ligase
VLDLRSDDVAYATSKLFFAYGLGGGLSFPLSVGGTTILAPDPFAPARTWRILAEETPTLLFAVPSAYRALLDAAPADAAPALARVRRCVSAGETLPETIARAWRARFGLDILDGLGATEALHIFLSHRPGAYAAGTVGTPVPGYDVRVVDERGAAVPAGTAGALRVRGASVAAGYWERPEAAARAFVDGRLVTGDRAVGEPDGSIRLLGRSDDLLKVSGQWVSPVEIEDVIGAVTGVRECAVVGAPGASGLTEPVAWIAPTGGDDALPARVAAACESLPRFKRPKHVRLIDALPRTPTGKIQRYLLRGRES